MGKSNPRYTDFDPRVLAEISRHAEPRLARLFACKVRVDASGCWLWIAGKDKDGYGIFSWFVGKDENGKKLYRSERAHRFAFRASHGWVPAELDHLTCDRKPCVHPCHCVPTTTAENIARTENQTAVNARKQLCKRGHELSAHPQHPNWRRCEVCRSEQNLRWKRENYTRIYKPKSNRKLPSRKFAHLDKFPRLTAE